MLIILSKSLTVEDYSTVFETAWKTREKGEPAAILHVQDACIIATNDEYCRRLAEGRVKAYALRADCQARGLLEKVGKNVNIIDYREWVKLAMEEHDKIVSWTT